MKLSDYFFIRRHPRRPHSVCGASMGRERRTNLTRKVTLATYMFCGLRNGLVMQKNFCASQFGSKILDRVMPNRCGGVAEVFVHGRAGCVFQQSRSPGRGWRRSGTGSEESPALSAQKRDRFTCLIYSVQNNYSRQPLGAEPHPRERGGVDV